MAISTFGANKPTDSDNGTVAKDDVRNQMVNFAGTDRATMESGKAGPIAPPARENGQKHCAGPKSCVEGFQLMSKAFTAFLAPPGRPAAEVVSQGRQICALALMQDPTAKENDANLKQG